MNEAEELAKGFDVVELLPAPEREAVELAKGFDVAEIEPGEE